MQLRHEQKRPRALAGAGAASELVTASSYRRCGGSASSPAIPPGARLAAHWLDCGDRCLSALYRYFTDAPGPAIQVVIQAAVDDDLTIGPELFGSPTQGNLLRIMVGCREAGLPVNTRSITTLAAQLGWPIVDHGGDEGACLRRVLGCESSAAGLTTWPPHLRDCALRRRMTRDLAATYSRTLDPRDAVPGIIAECAANLNAWRYGGKAVGHG